MIKIHNGLVHLDGNLLASIDFETTGLRAGYHEIVQIAVVPLNADLRPTPEVRPFYTNIAPNYPERAEVKSSRIHGLNMDYLMMNAPSQDKVADLLLEWWERLELPVRRSVVPLAHNWAFESAHGKAWLGDDLFSHMFHSHARDGMLLAVSMNDRAAFYGYPVPFSYVGLNALCGHFGITNEKAHDALSDARAEAEVYRALLHHKVLE